jgi:hypothetical protein
MKNKIIAILGIGSYILSVITSAEDLEGNFVSPIVLIAISGILTIIFTVAATVRLWKGARYVSIILASSAVILFILSVVQGIASPSYGSPIIILLNITKVINFIAFIWAVLRLWTMAKYEGLAKNSLEDSGLTPEEVSLVQEDLRKGNREAGVQRIATAQERQRTKFKEATGMNPFSTILVVGQDIKWTDIVRQVFRVLELDRADTTVLADGNVKAATRTEPYGYLLVESPILNVKARLPITHSADFALATTVYDEPRLAEVIEQTELLVTYFPKHKLPMGLAGITHALHYVIVPRGTLERYYEFNDDEHMANPAPEKLFKEFAWDGEIRVQVNSDPKF